jgi:hypothetical protein
MEVTHLHPAHRRAFCAGYGLQKFELFLFQT